MIAADDRHGDDERAQVVPGGGGERGVEAAVEREVRDEADEPGKEPRDEAGREGDCDREQTDHQNTAIHDGHTQGCVRSLERRSEGGGDR